MIIQAHDTHDHGNLDKKFELIITNSILFIFHTQMCDFNHQRSCNLYKNYFSSLSQWAKTYADFIHPYYSNSSTIYIIVNPNSKNLYIGETEQSVKSRFTGHYYETKAFTTKNQRDKPYLYKHLNKTDPIFNQHLIIPIISH